MKIVLQAFGNKLSGVMEVPEDTGRNFRLAMTQPIQAFKVSHSEQYDLMKSPIETICEFEWTGGIYHQEGHPYHNAREYQLIDIIKTT